MAGVPLIGDRLIGWWNSIDQQGVAFFYVLKPYVGEVGNWLLVWILIWSSSTATGRAWSPSSTVPWNA